MRLENSIKILVILGLALSWVVQGRANEPVFLQWLAPDDPGDITIRAYWDQYSADKLSPEEIVDLGTMLFSRGYPRDAERLFHEAIKRDKKLYEAWFRLGLVKHQEGDTSAARKAYRHCLKIFKGHGWCNFYLGLLEEQAHHAKEATKYFKKAFRYAPVLGDERVNPELQNSKLALGAWLEHSREQDFHEALPMAWLAPEKMAEVRKTATKEALKNSNPKGLKTFKLQEVPPKASVATEVKKIKTKPAQSQQVKAAREGQNRSKIHPVKKNKANPKKNTKRRTRPGVHPTPSPTPPPVKSEKNEGPALGLPGDHGVSSDGYPGF